YEECQPDTDFLYAINRAPPVGGKELYMDASQGRREFLKKTTFVAGLASAASLAGCTAEAPVSPVAKGEKRYKAAFSNVGLQATWCAHGMDTAKQWGEWLGVDVKIYDSQFSIEKQRRDVEDMATQDWDFVAIQAYGIKTLEEPVKRLIDKGVPVIDMDTRIVPEGDDIGLWTFVTPDHVKVAEQATEAIAEKMGYRGKLVHTQGALAHSGAQLRAQGCRNVLKKYPDIEVIDEQPGDWDISMVGRIWDDLLVKHKQIDGAFLHNDDMAMAAVQAVKRSGQKRNIVFGSIDAQDVGINGVISDDLIVSVMNPSGRIHGTSVMIGYFACALGQKQSEVPPEIIIDGPVVTRENAASFQYLMENLLI
ncbi:sugar ABC transporter substrate-binding protein, partial [Candidatus Hydrogenedentota bacterium]